MGNENSGQDIVASSQKTLFNIKFTSKSLTRESKKYTKNEMYNKKKCKKAMETGNIESARTYAEEGIQFRNKSMNYAKVSSRLDAVATQLQTLIQNNKLTKSIIQFMNKLDVVLKTMDINKITAMLDEFEQQFEDMDLSSAYMESAIDVTTSTCMPQNQVDMLMSQIADEASLGLNYITSSVGAKSTANNCIGLSVGGAKDIISFRKCIDNNIMPPVGSITFNGIFYDYYFDTKTRKSYDIIQKDVLTEKNENKSMLFYPSYCFARIKNYNSNENKIGNKYEYYMSLGLNSNIKMNDFKRKNLNLIVVLDKSGSMGSKFDNDEINGSKMKVANQSVVSLLKHLTLKDRFALVTFENVAEIIQELQFINDININDLKHKILNIKQTGGTNFGVGFNIAIQLYQKLFKTNIVNNNYENRIIFLTDAQPNIGNTNPKTLLSMVSKYSQNTMISDDNKINVDISCINHRIYTSFIGIGFDWNVNLIETISNTRGCNYFCVKSSQDFMNVMDEEFEFMVSPLVFNVNLKLHSEGNSCSIEKFYGRTDININKKINNIVNINTLFPSKRVNGKTKGGISLIKLKKNYKDKNEKDDAINVEIEVSFEDRNGKMYANKQMVTFKVPSSVVLNDMIEEEKNEYVNDNFYDNTGIAKGILLVKYVELIIEWIKETNNKNNDDYISDKYKKLFGNFLKYFKNEMVKCNDDTLQKEVKLMEKLVNPNTKLQYKTSDIDATASLEERLKKLQEL